MRRFHVIILTLNLILTGLVMIDIDHVISEPAISYDTRQMGNFTLFGYYGDEFMLEYMGDIDSDSVTEFIGNNRTYRKVYRWNAELNRFEGKVFANMSDSMYVYSKMNIEDLDGDDELDLISNNRLMRWHNGSFIRGNYSVDAPLSSTSTMVDIDADGDIDIVRGSPRGGLYVYRNNGRGMFKIDHDFMKGLPYYDAGGRFYDCFTLKLKDINKDGWPDMCAAVGDKYRQYYPAQDYFWLSDGHGNWTPFSQGCPMDDFGTGDPDYTYFINDFDGDGDEDCLVALRDRGPVFFLNDYPYKWKVVPLSDYFSMKGYTYGVFQTGDLDNDGRVDIVIGLRRGDKDGNDHSRYAVLWNKGNMTFEPEITKEFRTYPGCILPFVDINGDGSLDIVISPWDLNPTHDLPLVMLNNIKETRDLFIREPLIGNVTRTGMYTKIEWGSAKKSELLSKDTSFDLFISYWGEDGPYVTIKENIPKWWTYLKFPDFPSNDAYLKVEGHGLEAKFGPIRLFSLNDSKYLFEVKVSSGSKGIISGQINDFSIVPGHGFSGPIAVDVTLFNDESFHSLGTHDVEDGIVKRFSWTAPSDLFNTGLRIRTRYFFGGSEKTVIQDEIYNILDADHLADRIYIKGNRTILGKDAFDRLSFGTLSQSGRDLTSRSRYTVTWYDVPFSVLETDNDDVMIHGTVLGSGRIYVTVDCLGLSINRFIDIIIDKSIGSLEMSKVSEIRRTGDTISVTATAYDINGNKVTVENDEYSWEIEGTIEILVSHSSFLSFIAIGPGIIEINYTVIFKTGSLSRNVSIPVEDKLGAIEFSGIKVNARVGVPMDITLTVFDYKGEVFEPAEVQWAIFGPAVLENVSDRMIQLTPISDGELNLMCDITYYLENRSHSFLINSLPSLVDLIVVNVERTLPIGQIFSFNVQALDSTGELYSDPWDLQIYDSDSRALYRVEGDVLNVQGWEELKSQVTLMGVTGHGTVYLTLFFEFFDVIKSVSLNMPEKIVRNVPYMLEPIVNGILGRIEKDLIVNISADNGRIMEENGEHYLIPIETGHVNIQLIVSRYSSNVSLLYETHAVPYSIGIEFGITGPMRKGLEMLVDPFLVLENGSISSDFILEFEPVPGLDIGRHDLSYSLVSNVLANYKIGYRAHYHNQMIEGVINVECIEKPILISIMVQNGLNGSYMIFAYDQFLMDITSLCTIEIEGDHNRMDHSSFEALSGKVIVHVSYNGTTISREIVVDVVTNGEIPLAMILLVVGSILVLLIAGILLIAWRRGSQPRRSEGSKEE